MLSLNDPSHPRNKAAVIRAFPSVLALAALTNLVGCGAPARSPGPPGSTVILLENKVAEPCQLSWANVRVDDRPVRLMTIAPPGAKPAPLDRPVLKPGPHTISISATASCVTKDSDEPAVTQITQPIYMGKDGGSVTISVAQRGTGSAIEATFTVDGGHLLDPRADGGDVNCASREPMDRAICRTEATLAHAHEKRDVVLVMCVSEKLREMRVLSATVSTETLAPAKDDPAIRGVREGVEERVVALGLEADHCIGETFLADPGTRIDKPRAAPTAFK